MALLQLLHLLQCTMGRLGLTSDRGFDCAPDVAVVLLPQLLLLGFDEVLFDSEDLVALHLLLVALAPRSLGSAAACLPVLSDLALPGLV